MTYGLVAPAAPGVRGVQMFTSPGVSPRRRANHVNGPRAALYTFAVDALSGDFSGSALLAYKLNWQSVLFVGYGVERTLADPYGLDPVGRQVFAKISYTCQH